MLTHSHSSGPVSKVTAAHLGRAALLYVRQSTLKQVLHNTESRSASTTCVAGRSRWLDHRPGQRHRHRPGPVRCLRRDREGFQQLVAEVSLGRAGIVLGLECSRLARNSADWHSSWSSAP